MGPRPTSGPARFRSLDPHSRAGPPAGPAKQPEGCGPAATEQEREHCVVLSTCYSSLAWEAY
jgi:hypothetical protein